jgi:hypothetical protein
VGVTGKEFAKKVMRRFQSKAEEVLAENHIEESIVVSYDHAGAHDSAEATELLEAMGITQDAQSRMPLPPLSPDFHRVIEHVHAIASRAFNVKLRNTEGRRSINKYKEMYEEAFYEAVNASSVQDDIRGLKLLWEYVRKSTEEGGSEGDWGKTSML